MRSDTILGIFAIIFGGIYSAQALALPKASIGNPWAPIYFPLSLGVLLVAFGILLILKSMKSKKAGRVLSFPREAMILIAGTLVLCSVYIFLFEKIGFISSTMIFMASVLTFINEFKNWKTNLTVAVSFTLLIWYVFEKLFYINLP
ncbi:MAG: tripartite tricarboxylate transporter TctB family protein [Synergistales bacterium]|nr:tripartite tricarboxylate transporter TctB family protein [Synergistales bacterium]